MSRLVLVRHGQAEAFSDNPDRLSRLGWDQCLALGRYWLECGVSFDAAFHGSLRRQRESYEAARRAYRRAGAPFPRATEVAGLNEYSTQDLVTTIAPRIARADRAIAPLWDSWLASAGGPSRNRDFQRLFEALAMRWARGEISDPLLEPWEDFRSRTEAALDRVRSGHRKGASVVAFTSGGPIGIAVQSCLRAPPSSALDVNWRVRNCSLTSFVFSGPRISLDGFNELPHFATSPGLVSFR